MPSKSLGIIWTLRLKCHVIAYVQSVVSKTCQTHTQCKPSSLCKLDLSYMYNVCTMYEEITVILVHLREIWLCSTFLPFSQFLNDWLPQTRFHLFKVIKWIYSPSPSISIKNILTDLFWFSRYDRNFAVFLSIFNEIRLRSLRKLFDNLLHVSSTY